MHEKMQHVEELARGYMGSRIFLTAVELGIFERIGRGSATARDLAGSIGADPTATEILLDALAGLGLLAKHGEEYYIGSEPAGFLVPGSPGYRAEAFRHIANLWEPWSMLTEVVRRGRSPQRAWTAEKSLALAVEMERQAEGKAEWLASLLGGEKVRKILDLGGGSGCYAVAFARCFPFLRAVIFDRDARALDMANERIRQGGFGERIETRKGDFFRDPLGEGYDLVILSSVACILGPDENRFVLGRAREALGPDGRIAVLDIILDDSRIHPPGAAIFAVNMLLTSASGRGVTLSEIKEWLEGAGFTDVHRLPAGHFRLVVARKSS